MEIKKDETAIKELSKFLRCPFITYSLEEIKKVEHKFKGSEFVRKTIGVGSVCEPSIELKGGKIIKEKAKTKWNDFGYRKTISLKVFLQLKIFKTCEC